MSHDLVIRGGHVLDGTGRPGFAADIAIDGGMITAIGTVPARGAEEINAHGLLVTPGFVDIHTHYDGQAVWDSHLAPLGLAWRDHGADGQLRRRFRPLPRGGSRHADRADGRRRGYPRPRAA